MGASTYSSLPAFFRSGGAKSYRMRPILPSDESGLRNCRGSSPSGASYPILPVFLIQDGPRTIAACLWWAGGKVCPDTTLLYKYYSILDLKVKNDKKYIN